MEKLLSTILSTNSSSKEIKEALNLFSVHPVSGLPVRWSSSNPDVLANSGRVIRPKWDEPAEDVTLTAWVDEKEAASFDLTVLPEKYIGDTMATTDDKFFGFYHNGGWRAPGLLRYDDFPELNAVRSAAQADNYALAKEELLKYMRNKVAQSEPVTRGYNKLESDYMRSGASQTDYSYCTAEAAVTDARYRKIEIPLKYHEIKPCSYRSYCLISKHRDCVTLNFAGSSYGDESMRPAIRLNVNGTPKYYYAVQSATIRGGEYKKTHIGTSEELTVKMFGEFIGNETYRSLLKFDFGDLMPSDEISDVVLILYGKKSNAFSEDKAFFVMKEPSTTWDGDTVAWLDLSGLYYSFNGIDGGNHWNKVEGANVEYLVQAVRFNRFLHVAAEYQHTGDENCAYYVIYSIIDFIAKKDSMHVRVLDSNLRMKFCLMLFKMVINSRYMTPDICTAIVKRFFKAITDFTNDTVYEANSTISKFEKIIEAASFFEEYTDTPRCKQVAVDYFNKNIVIDFFPDGAYVEDSGCYHKGTFKSYVSAKRTMKKEGIQCSEEFDKRLRLAAYYYLLLRGPNGECLGFGDENPQYDYEYNECGELIEWYGDTVLQYIDTQGKKGTRPDYTSVSLPYSTYTFLRNDWAPDAQMLFTNVRHGSNHGHADDNGIILFGYGKNLLADAGYIDYQATPERLLGTTTLMHNTVEINGQSQKTFGYWVVTQDDTGVTNDFVAKENYDFVSQTSYGYQHIENEHTRSITFIKPDFYIVSDIMRPVNKTELNKYKQLWHMTPGSGLYTKDGNIYSNHSTPGNLIIANADNAELFEAKGVYTIDYGGVAEAPYAYYYKEGAGDVTFDSVILPYKSESSDLKAERIDLGVDSSEATALKISVDKDGVKSTVYYMLQHTKNGEITFGKYRSNAKTAVVIEDEYGELRDFMIYDGEDIKTLDGTPIKKN